MDLKSVLACLKSNVSMDTAAEAIVIRCCVFASDRRLLVAVFMLFWRLNPRSAATLDTGITSATSASALKSGNISPSEVMSSRQEPLNEGFPDPASTLFIGRKSLCMRSFSTSGAAAPRGDPYWAQTRSNASSPWVFNALSAVGSARRWARP